MSHRRELTALGTLLRSQRWAALATLENGRPYASAVAYVPEADFTGLFLHLSQLAPHTRNLLQDSSASLLISETDDGTGDPQTLARTSLLGRCTALARHSPEYRQARQRYLDALPDAEPLFSFNDFILFRFEVEEARYVGGFGRAFSFKTEQMPDAARLSAATE